MKTLITSIVLFTTTCFIATAEPIYFNWTADGNNQYNAFFEYSGGSVVNGIFTPTGLITYSFGTPFGIITPATHYPDFRFQVVDTPYGPSFQTQGVIEPIGYENFFGDNLSFYFQGIAEDFTFFTNGTTKVTSLTGTWTETIPDATNSWLLLAASAGGLALLRKRLA